MAAARGRAGKAGTAPAAQAGPAGVRALTRVFRGLADESRVRILLLLELRGELTVTAICDAVGQSQPAVSHHLAQLRAAGLVDCRRARKFSFYRPDPAAVLALFGTLFPSGPPLLTVGGMDIRPTRKGSS